MGMGDTGWESNKVLRSREVQRIRRRRDDKPIASVVLCEDEIEHMRAIMHVVARWRLTFIIAT